VWVNTHAPSPYKWLGYHARLLFFFQIIYDNILYTLIFFIEKDKANNVLLIYVSDDALSKSDN